MPTTSGTSLKGRQVIVVSASTDTLWSIRVSDPAFPTHLQTKYYGFMSFEVNLGALPQPFQIGGDALWTAGKLLQIPRFSGATVVCVMHWRVGGIPWVGVTS